MWDSLGEVIWYCSDFIDSEYVYVVIYFDSDWVEVWVGSYFIYKRYIYVIYIFF